MTREDAIVMQKAMRDNLHETGKDYPYRDDMIPLMKESCDMAIKALEQQPCEDCISRQTDNLCSSCTNIRCAFQSGIVRTECAFYIPPHIEPDNCGNYVIQEPKTGHWIPVSKRLPEEFESVLVCYKSQGGMAQCVTERFVNMDGSNLWSAMYGQKPIAWMPLPEPYKAESEDKE